VNIVDFAVDRGGRLVRGSLHFHTPCVFVVMRHVSRVTAYFKYVHQEWLSHISDHPLLVRRFVAIYKHPFTSLSGKNLANNGHSS